MLGHNWEPAEGTCIDERISTGGSEHTSWLMEVRPRNAPAFRVELGYPGIGSDFKGPNPGQVCRMEVDVKKQKAKFDHTDPTLSWKAHRAERHAQFEAELKGAPGTPAVGISGTGFPAGFSMPGNYQVISGADAAPLLDALFSGHAEESIAALRAMKHGQQPPAGTAAPFGAPEQAQPTGMAAPFGAPEQAQPQVQAATTGDPAERLAKLQALHDQGLLSYSEYAAQRQRIIEAL